MSSIYNIIWMFNIQAGEGLSTAESGMTFGITGEESKSFIYINQFDQRKHQAHIPGMVTSHCLLHLFAWAASLLNLFALARSGSGDKPGILIASLLLTLWYCGETNNRLFQREPKNQRRQHLCEAAFDRFC